jgi:hypothetical protein
MCFADDIDVSPVDVLRIATSWGETRDPVASMTSTPAFFSTKFW